MTTLNCVELDGIGSKYDRGWSEKKAQFGGRSKPPNLGGFAPPSPLAPTGTDAFESACRHSLFTPMVRFCKRTHARTHATLSIDRGLGGGQITEECPGLASGGISDLSLMPSLQPHYTQTHARARVMKYFVWTLYQNYFVLLSLWLVSTTLLVDLLLKIDVEMFGEVSSCRKVCSLVCS